MAIDATHAALFGSVAVNALQFGKPLLDSLLNRRQLKAQAESSTVGGMAQLNSALQAEIERLSKELERSRWEAEQWKEIAITGSRLVTTATEVAAHKQGPRNA